MGIMFLYESNISASAGAGIVKAHAGKDGGQNLFHAAGREQKDNIFGGSSRVFKSALTTPVIRSIS
jgi:hypothetical protein